MTPEAYCEDRAAKSGSSFYYGFRFLPKEKRAAMTALYAYCREVDDVVDECSDASVARQSLQWWGQETAAMFAGEPTHPVTRALAPIVKKYELDQSLFLEILRGMEMDLSYFRYQSFADLQVYCHRVAGVVGLLSAQVFGFQDEKTLDYAATLGLALQLTNIIRDVGEDARRGRIYLPLEDLAQFSVKEETILAYQETPEFRALMRFQMDRAEQVYTQALALLPKIDRRKQLPGLCMAAIYRDLLHEIARDDPAMVLNQRVSLTPMRKLWLIGLTAMGWKSK